MYSDILVKHETKSYVYHTKSLFKLPLAPYSSHISNLIKKIIKLIVGISNHIKAKLEYIDSYQIKDKNYIFIQKDLNKTNQRNWIFKLDNPVI